MYQDQPSMITMFRYHTSNDNHVIAELTDENFIIKDSQDAIDLITHSNEGCDRFIIYKKNLHEDFFNLGSGIAGDILQKFSNYRIRLGVIGDFSGFKSKNLNDFFRESNRMGRILFLDNIDEALARLGK
jgi:hypothetical protein